MTATLVIADDHPLMRDGLGALFANAGYGVVACCADGNAAKRAIAEDKPTLTVLDVSMPGATGLISCAGCVADTRRRWSC